MDIATRDDDHAISAITSRDNVVCSFTNFNFEKMKKTSSRTWIDSKSCYFKTSL